MTHFRRQGHKCYLPLSGVVIFYFVLTFILLYINKNIVSVPLLFLLLCVKVVLINCPVGSGRSLNVLRYLVFQLLHC